MVFLYALANSSLSGRLWHEWVQYSVPSWNHTSDTKSKEHFFPWNVLVCIIHMSSNTRSYIWKSIWKNLYAYVFIAWIWELHKFAFAKLCARNDLQSWLLVWCEQRLMCVFIESWHIFSTTCKILGLSQINDHNCSVESSWVRGWPSELCFIRERLSEPTSSGIPVLFFLDMQFPFLESCTQELGPISSVAVCCENFCLCFNSERNSLQHQPVRNNWKKKANTLFRFWVSRNRNCLVFFGFFFLVWCLFFFLLFFDFLLTSFWLSCSFQHGKDKRDNAFIDNVQPREAMCQAFLDAW